MTLKCIGCGAGGLREAGDGWTCERCGRTFPIVGGVSRFVRAEDYSESFGFQWTHFARTQLDSASGERRSREEFMEKTGLQPPELRGKRVLDAGCGMGRLAEVCAEAGAEVHAVDLSVAVEAAFRNLQHRPNLRLYQADIMHLPFEDETFDIIYSLGVLHHTPGTKAAFLRLPPLLKPGGTIAVCVYSLELKRFWGGEVLRRFTPSLPKRWLLRATKAAIPLYHVHNIPLLGRLTSVLLPTSMDPDAEWRWLNTFDWYSPKYQWKHSFEEVEGWFAEAALTQISRGVFPISVRGTRPQVRPPSRSPDD